VKISTVIQPTQESFPSLVVEIPKSRVIYIILGLFFGCLGIHNFYANRNRVGAGQLLLLLLFFWTIIVPFIVVVGSIVEICTVKTDGNGIPMN
jgi:TM2 domain-containing membrane protein YozV